MKKAIIQLHNVAQGSEQWKASRVGKFSGSNAYKLLSSFGAQEYAKAVADNFSGNYWTKRGHLLEDEAIELYEAIYKCKVTRTGYVTNSLYENCVYSPDGLTDTHLLEVKCFSEAEHKKLVASIPLKIAAQIQFGLLITGMKRARLIAYCPLLEAHEAFRVIEVKANRNALNNFKRILQHV